MRQSFRLVATSQEPGRRRVLDLHLDKGGRVVLVLREVEYEPATELLGSSESYMVFRDPVCRWVLSVGKSTTKPAVKRFLEALNAGLINRTTYHGLPWDELVQVVENAVELCELAHVVTRKTRALL
jgi:hypothetical protein